MKVFMTGATGVIGRRAVPLLLHAGHEVTAVGRAPDKRALLEQVGARVIEVSLFDEAALRAAVAGHEVVINLATHIPSSMRMLLPGAWAENDRVRRTGSANLARAASAAGASRLVQESFAPVYPDSGDAWIDESVPIQPPRYSRTVADAERSAEGFTAAGRSGVVLRFGAFYGPDARHLVDTVRILRRGFAPLPGAPGAFISSVSHDDAAAAVASSLDLPAGVYNVTDDVPVTHREYFDSLADALGLVSPRLPPPWATFLFGPAGVFARSVRISNRKLREASDWRPRYRSVREGWRALAAAWQTSPRSSTMRRLESR
jgi:nucleoside-diphosphate-sugar epimerase